MSQIQPRNISRLPFGMGLSAGTDYILCGGTSGDPSPFVANPLTGDERFIPGMERDALVIAWEVRNNGSNDINIRFGPNTGTFTAAVGTTTDNYITLPPNASYNFSVPSPYQQVNDQVGGATYSILMVRSASGAGNFTAMATVWNPSDG